MIIDCISDLHGEEPYLSGGDLLIVAGDLTASDRLDQLQSFKQWLCRQKYKKKIVIAGNHDNHLQQGTAEFYEDEGINYLQDSGTEFEGMKIWGSPWTRHFTGMNPHCCAFTCITDIQMKEKWDLIPEDTNILVTHSPPKGILDRTARKYRVGCDYLSEIVNSRKLPDLKLHVFGHIHEGYGQAIFEFGDALLGKSRTVRFVNAAHMNRDYEGTHPPIRIEL